MSINESEAPFRILFVDDDEDQLLIVRHLLRRLVQEIEVDSATSPEEALGMLEEGHYNCVVSDLLFPGVSGVEFARKVKERQSTPFVIYSGMTNEEAIGEALDVGVDDYCFKEAGRAHHRLLIKRIINLATRHRAEEALGERYESREGGMADSERVLLDRESLRKFEHDLRGALGKVVGALDLIEMDPGRLKQMMDIIRKSVAGAVETIQEFRASHT
jgi:PleD family two-component response regulator